MGARVTKPRAFRDRYEDGSKTKQMVPFIALVTEKKLGCEMAQTAFLAANGVVF
jgi:hypothetical protein